MKILSQFKFFIIIILIFTLSCTILGIYSIKKATQNVPDEYRNKVIETIESAGKNKKELIKVIKHYESNPQKLEAASFLIANMKNHKYVKVGIFDSLGNEIKFNVLDYDNYHQIVDYLDSLEVKRGELYWDKILEEKDPEVISADYLIKNLDLAFKAYATLPWTKKLDWKIFLQYVLPYRGSSEPISPWRSYFWKEFADLRDSTDDPLILSQLINKRCKKLLTFKDVYYLHPTDQSLSEMLESGYGRCEDMTNFSIYAMRANGLAVTSDYTPHWPDGSNNHAWNAIILPEGEVIPFMGSEANPGDYSLSRKIAKVYRKLFFEEKGSLANQLKEDEKAPAWLNYPNYKDVTDKYTETIDIKIEDLKPEKKWAYLAVYNSNEWKAIQWGKIDNTGDALFTKMGKDIVYLPMYYEKVDSIENYDDKKPEYKLKTASNPFILSKEGKITKFDNRNLKEREIVEKDIYLKKIAKSKKIKPENEYKLFIWIDEWSTLRDSITNADSVMIKKYYENSLYKIEDKEDNPEVRIFTIKNNKQEIW